jgi:homoserine dehydrogenase
MTQQSTTRQEAPASIGIALLGAGVVGGGVAHSIGAHAAEYERRIGRRLELRQILVRNPEKVRGTSVDPGIVTTDFDQILSDPKIQIVVEVMGGEEPAYRYLCQTLESRRYAVTANKEVMAKHGPELLSLARRNGVDILFEASVGGGIPLIAPLKRDLIANEITSLRAIVNGTTNYILTRMSSEGIDFADALEQAQALGYAEADPTNDVEGIDAAYKLCILASLAFRTAVFPADVYHEGITRLRANDFRYARELGYAINPVLLREDEPLSKVDGVFNAVELEGDLTGLVLFQGQGAGSFPTSSAVLADVIDIAREIGLGQSGRAMEPYSASQQIRPFEELESRHYLRLRVPDRAGVLSKICGVLGDQYGISISDIIQKETSQEDQSTEIVIMTHAAREASMRAALMELEQLPVVNEIGNFIRVETPR